MKYFIEGALRMRWWVVGLAIVLMAGGFKVLRGSPMDVFPEFSPLIVEVQTEAVGLSAEEVENLVSIPIENSVNGIRGLKTLRSKSVQGLSSVVLLFDDKTKLMEARQLVQERLQYLAGRLPVAARLPVMLSPLSSLSRILKIGISSKTLSQTEMTNLVRWTLRPQLMAISGVANVAIWGQRDQQIQIQLNSEKMREERVTLNEVLRASQDALSSVSGGFLETPNQRFSVIHSPNILTAKDLNLVAVAPRFGRSLALGQIAQIQVGHQVGIGDAVVNDGPGLLLIIEKQIGANTLEVTSQVERAIEKLKPGLPGLEIDTTIFRPSSFIEMSLDNLKKALLWGCFLVAAILIAFLWEWRVALISLTAIPLSLVTAAMILSFFGMTLNTMMIAGLAIALGEVVDDAIIDVENVLRRLRLNKSEAQPRAPISIILEASLEVRSAVVYATMIVILVFVPVFFLDGLAGTFFRPLALSYILAVVASLFVALFVTPVLCLILLPQSNALEKKENRWVLKLKESYRAVLLIVFRNSKPILGLVLVAFIMTGLSLPFLGEELLPKFKEYDFLMHWVAKPGTSLPAMTRTVERVSKELRAIPGVRNFGAHIGRAEAADEVVGANFSELWISVDPKADYKATLSQIQAVIDGYPGLQRDVLTYLKERIKEVISGGSGAIVVRIFGPNLQGLRSQAGAVEKAMSTVPGVSHLLVEAQVDIPQLEIKIKPDKALQAGVTAGDIRNATTTFVRGTKVGEILQDQKIVDVMVWSAENNRDDIEKISAILIDTSLGGKVALGDVATVEMRPTPNVIQRENSSRKIDVSCNAEGADLGAVARDIESKLKNLDMGEGYHFEILGEYATRQASRQRLILLSIFSLLGIFLILYADFKSIRLATLVFISLPFALIGGVIGVFLTGGVISLGSLVGFVTVLGISARNGVMLVSHYHHLNKVEKVEFNEEFILLGAQERLTPILMTAAATGLALLPIIVGGNIPGHEIEYPMAVIIVGGLVSSTLLNLFIMPYINLKNFR